MTNKWVVLSETEAECIEQSKMPVLQNLGGKHAPLFPLYIQCRSSKDAEEVLQLHEPLLELYASHPDRMELARAIYRTLECPNILSGVAWYVLLNGRSFRGLLFSTTDFDAQTRDFQYSSWRKAHSLEDALLIMVLRGEKSLLAEIKTPAPSMPVLIDIGQLRLSPSPARVEGMYFPGEAMAPAPSSHRGTTAQLPSTTAEYKFNFRAPKLPGSYSQWPRAPVHLPGNGFSIKPVYKYIRNIAGTVGTINDRSGVLSKVTEEDRLVLGALRASYIDSHGYESKEVMQIVAAFDAPTIEEFISRAEGCGMSIVELEWFWCLD